MPRQRLGLGFGVFEEGWLGGDDDSGGWGEGAFPLSPPLAHYSLEPRARSRAM